MAIKKIYIGSLGPFEYDDSEPIDDPDGDFPGETKQAVRSNGVVQGGSGAFVGGSSGSINIVTDIRFNSTTLEYKHRTVTLSNGCISALGTESAWTTVPTV